MILSQLLQSFIPESLLDSLPEVQVAELQLDSRALQAGDVFVAVRGTQVDGRNFIDAAIERGAVAVLADTDLVQAHISERNGCNCIYIPNLSGNVSRLAMTRYLSEVAGVTNVPYLVGITGTNGKTSISHYIATLAQACGVDAGVIGTTGFGKPGALQTLNNTTPDPISVARIIAQLARQGCQLIAMEVSSHGLEQGRVASVPFAQAVFSNLSRDHLDYHGDMAQYGAAKKRLFLWPELQAQIINVDDAFAHEQLLNDAQLQHKLGYSLDPQWQPSTQHWLKLQRLQRSAAGFSVQLNSHEGLVAAQVPLIGEFNLANVLAALSCLMRFGIPLAQLAAAMEQLSCVPGRMECFFSDSNPTQVVDYAHTPDALQKALLAVRAHCAGQLWCVFGCGGDRDQGKRPLMAQAAEQFADRLILTSDNPRSESQDVINEHMRAGLEQPQHALFLADRKQAIEAAFAQAAPQDWILIAGKGHEDYQIVGNDVLHFSDRELAQTLAQAHAGEPQ